MEVIEENYRKVMDKPLRILQIFNEFFGEDKVDMQGFPSLDKVKEVLPANSDESTIRTYISSQISGDNGFILVYFPVVKITNEYDKSVTINDLFAKVNIGLDGTLLYRFTLNRANYTMLHMMNDYMHSHISTIPFEDFTRFQSPCTGSGPINNTICSLAREFDEDIWKLFCLELDKYVHVESIAGTPYHRLESLRIGGYHSIVACYNIFITNFIQNTCARSSRGSLTPRQLASFIKYVIDNKVLKFNYVNNGFYPAMSPTQFYIKISNAFIDWYNLMKHRGEQFAANNLQELISSGTIKTYKLSNGKLYSPGRYSPENYLQYIGKKVCDFKGKPVLVTITDAPINRDEENSVHILDEYTSCYVLTKIINVLNFRYGNSRSEEGDTPRKKVCFL